MEFIGLDLNCGELGVADGQASGVGNSYVGGMPQQAARCSGRVRKLDEHKAASLAPRRIPGNLSNILNSGSARSGEGHPTHENQYCGRHGC